MLVQLARRKFSLAPLLAPLLTCGLALLPSQPSLAYVRTRTGKSDTPVQWTIDCIVMRPDARGSQDVPLADVQTTLQRAINNWTTRTASCPGLALSMRPASGNLDVAQDGVNALVFRNDNWEHDPAAIGLTTVVYVDTPGQIGDGTILDADIELNDVNYTFTLDPATATGRDGTMVIDLESTMTHELGHVQGLAHTCWDHVTATPPIDNTGMPIPDCNGTLPASIIDTTMYPYYTMTGETSKRTLSADDVAGVCDVYKDLAPTLACYPEIDGGCAVAATPSPARWPLAFFGCALAISVVARRRRC